MNTDGIDKEAVEHVEALGVDLPQRFRKGDDDDYFTAVHIVKVTGAAATPTMRWSMPWSMLWSTRTNCPTSNAGRRSTLRHISLSILRSYEKA